MEVAARRNFDQQEQNGQAALTLMEAAAVPALVAICKKKGPDTRLSPSLLVG